MENDSTDFRSLPCFRLAGPFWEWIRADNEWQEIWIDQLIKLNWLGKHLRAENTNDPSSMGCKNLPNISDNVFYSLVQEECYTENDVKYHVETAGLTNLNKEDGDKVKNSMEECRTYCR